MGWNEISIGAKWVHVHRMRYKRIEQADIRAFFSMKDGYFENLYEKISQQMGWKQV